MATGRPVTDPLFTICANKILDRDILFYSILFDSIRFDSIRF